MPGDERPLSFSALNTFIECGEKYRLRYLEGYREDTPAWWSVGGSAVHAISEKFDRGELTLYKGGCHPDDWAYAIADGIAEQIKRYPDTSMSDWKVNGAKEGREYWSGDQGKGHIDRYIMWRTETQWPLLILPDGQPAVEVSVTGTIGGKPFVGYIDRVFVPDGEVTILDLKSGKSVPTTHLQHGVYRALLEQTLGVTASKGAFFKTRAFKTVASGLTTPVDLDPFTPELLRMLVGNLQACRDSGAFTPSPSWLCGTCGVREQCRIAATLPSLTEKRKPSKFKPIAAFGNHTNRK